MGLLTSVALLGLLLIVVLAIAAASSAPQSAPLIDGLLPSVKTSGESVEAPVKTPPGDRSLVPPVIFAAGLQ